MDATYLFYDLETTGLNKSFDQILQFAAIRTDLNLQEIERHELQFKLKPTVIPSPRALITHRISIEKMQQGETEINAIRTIHALFNTPGTISLGYNTLHFDDEFLRFTFYRNLLTPYTHQYANHCRRMDLYPMVIMYYLYKHEALCWPTRNNRLSLKLEDINHANQFVEGRAHEAMTDVKITLALAHQLKQHEDMWEYVSGYFQKNIDLERSQKLPFSLKTPTSEHQEALMISGKMGSEHAFQAPVLCLGQHNHYRNQMIWLRLDQEQLSKATADTIKENTFAISKKTAEQQFLLPPHKRFLDHLSPARKILTDQNRQWLQRNPELFNLICSYHRDYKHPFVPNMDISAALYDLNFPPPSEEKLYLQFHQAQPEEKENIAEKFSDPVRQELAMRLLAENYPNHLSTKNKLYYTNFLQQCNANDNQPVDYQNKPRQSKAAALAEIQQLRQEKLDSEQVQLLAQYEEYLFAV